MTSTIFEAVKASGVRALVSAGWGGLGGKDVPDNVFILGNVPHDWLFTKVSRSLPRAKLWMCLLPVVNLTYPLYFWKVSAVCHHGGAGTCSVGLLNGKATIVGKQNVYDRPFGPDVPHPIQKLIVYARGSYSALLRRSAVLGRDGVQSSSRSDVRPLGFATPSILPFQY
jgi:hypothetical protein